MSNFSERLKELMEDYNLSLVELEQKIGVNHGNLSAYLSDKSLPVLNTLEKILYFFNCSADFILGLDEFPCEEKLYDLLPFGDRLRQILFEKKISQEKLKRELPVSGSVLYKWITGKSSPVCSSLIKLATYLDCSVDYLIGRRR